MVETLDYAIIGGGVIGSALARELATAKKGSRIAVFDKESHGAKHASGRNSGVVHSGFNALPETLKSRLCVEGNRLLCEYAREKRVPLRQKGTFVVARNKEEEYALYRIYGQGTKAGVPNLQMLTAEGLNVHEPAVKAKIGLYSPSGAIIDSVHLVNQLATDAQELGVTYLFNQRVEGIDEGMIITSERKVLAQHIINCAGLYADKIAHKMNVGAEYEIIPFRGEYVQVKGAPIHSMVYPAPVQPEYPFLGVHFTTTLEGKVLAGPNSVLSFGRESYRKEVHVGEVLDMVTTPNFWNMVFSRSFLKLAYENALTSFSQEAFLREANALLKEPVSLDQISPYRGGIRAQLVNNKGKMEEDIIVLRGNNSTHVLNAVSPGMTCSLAFAKYLVKEYIP